MNSFDGKFDLRLPLSHALMKSVGTLREFRGKEELYRKQMPEQLETLKLAAVIQSTESSNRIEGVTAAPKRIQELVQHKTTPRDRAEQEIAGYRNVLDIIHSNHREMKLTSGLVRQLHREMFKFSDEEGGRWKSTANKISEFRSDGTEFVRFQPPAPHLVDSLMQSLHERFDTFAGRGDVERLFLISAYVLDFLCIHPFRDGNGRMARLLTLLLLYQSDYGVGRYVSLEKIVEDSKESYYETLYQSSVDWATGGHRLLPWTEYFLGTLTAAYREFSNRVDLITTAHGSKTELILDALDRQFGQFSVQDIIQSCPTASIDLVRHILKEQKSLGKVECLGRGRASRWQKTEKWSR